MSTLLQIDSSGKGPMSTTRPLTQYFAEQWKAHNPSGKVIYRDLLASKLSFVNAELVGAYYTPEDQQNEHQRNLLLQSNELVDELFNADVYVIGAPMYNFTVPAVLKAYIDLTVRAGKTFSYADGRPQGLLKNKKLIILSASGADYTQPPFSSLNFVEPYLRSLFGFLGVQDVSFFTAPGRDPDTIAAASANVRKQIDQLLGAPVAVS